MQGMCFYIFRCRGDPSAPTSDGHAEGNGKCRHCESVGAICSTSSVPRKRPYYKVSEEEYESSMRLLRHFVPDTELNFENVKRMLAQLDGHHDAPAVSSSSPICRMPLDEGPKQTESSRHAPDKVPECDDETIVLENTGPMIIDPSGKYRQCLTPLSCNLLHVDRPRICGCGFFSPV